MPAFSKELFNGQLSTSGNSVALGIVNMATLTENKALNSEQIRKKLQYGEESVLVLCQVLS